MKTDEEKNFEQTAIERIKGKHEAIVLMTLNKETREINQLADGKHGDCMTLIAGAIISIHNHSGVPLSDLGDELNRRVAWLISDSREK
jgi:hypothetical protein